MRAMLAVPLSDRGRTIGTVVVCSRLAQRFGADEQRFLESLSNLLATSLQRAQSEDALKHAQRLESVGQLTGGIAHDFNNLLTVIQGNLQVLEELPALADDAYGQQLVAAAARASRRGAELTGKLLAFSRRQVLQPSSLNVGQLLQSLADMLRRTLDQRIHIEVDMRRACPPVLADPGQLESALLNIAINARDAMREGGTLRFRGPALQRLAGRGAQQPGRPQRAAGRLRRHRHRRHRQRHDRRRQAARLRALLHHQGSRPRHRPGPEHGLWLRAPVQGRAVAGQRPRRRHHADAVPAAALGHHAPRSTTRPNPSRRCRPA